MLLVAMLGRLLRMAQVPELSRPSHEIRQDTGGDHHIVQRLDAPGLDVLLIVVVQPRPCLSATPRLL